MAKITRYRGDTAADQITVTDNSGTVINISSYTFILTISAAKAPVSTEGLLATVSGVIASAAAGQVEFVFSSTQADQAPGVYYYDVQMVDNNGRVSTIVRDKYEFIQDLTKA